MGITPEQVTDELASIAFGGEEVRASDRLRALELLGRTLGLYGERTNEPPDTGVLAGVLAQLAEPEKPKRKRRGLARGPTIEQSEIGERQMQAPPATVRAGSPCELPGLEPGKRRGLARGATAEPSEAGERQMLTPAGSITVRAGSPCELPGLEPGKRKAAGDG